MLLSVPSPLESLDRGSLERSKEAKDIAVQRTDVERNAPKKHGANELSKRLWSLEIHRRLELKARNLI